MIWQGEELKDDFTLDEYGISFGAILRLVLGLRGGPINESPSFVFDMDNMLSQEAHESEENRPLTVLVFQNGDQIKMFKFDASALSETASSGQRTVDTSSSMTSEEKPSLSCLSSPDYSNSTDNPGLFDNSRQQLDEEKKRFLEPKSKTGSGKGKMGIQEKKLKRKILKEAEKEKRRQEDELLRLKMDEIQKRMKSLSFRRNKDDSNKKGKASLISKLPAIHDNVKTGQQDRLQEKPNQLIPSPVVLPPLMQTLDIKTSKLASITHPILTSSPSPSSPSLNLSKKRSTVTNPLSNNSLRPVTKANTIAKIIRKSSKPNNSMATINDEADPSNGPTELTSRNLQLLKQIISANRRGRSNSLARNNILAAFTQLVQSLEHQNEISRLVTPPRISRAENQHLSHQDNTSCVGSISLIDNGSTKSRPQTTPVAGTINDMRNLPSFNELKRFGLTLRQQMRTTIKAKKTGSIGLPPVKTKATIKANRCSWCNKKLGLATRYNCR